MPNLFEKFRKQSRQFEATRGRPIAPSVTSKFLEAELRVDAERNAINEERGERIATSREAREELKRGRTGKAISGVGQLALTSAVVGETALGKKVGGFAKDKFGSLSSKLLPSTVETATKTAPSLGLSTAAETASDVIPNAVTSGVVPKAAPSLLSTGASAVGAGGVGLVGDTLGRAIVGEDSDTAGALGGAAAGFLYGSAVPGIGNIAGGLAGFTASLVKSIFDW